MTARPAGSFRSSSSTAHGVTERSEIDIAPDDLEPPGCDVLVIGCGNLLRGDDGVGPVLVRHLWDRGVPDGAELVDGGTAGMDVGFQMRGARRVVIVDACLTPGRPRRNPRHDLPGSGARTVRPATVAGAAHLLPVGPPYQFARWALGAACPTDITVFLIEAAAVELGAELSAPVARPWSRSSV